ncbi:hypothetical protein L3X38_032238 [Prunus dulcis]|uniref:Uncharacterized protein n=1 Tax=Prunus dulcis TaxID=3755 RepID=A0AAD4YVQ7_PRUDU|nr:hypothetical protein L3X38_032238 [Prunus dulcis]
MEESAGAFIGDWESPSNRPVHFRIPTTFQIVVAEAWKQSEVSRIRLLLGAKTKKQRQQQLQQCSSAQKVVAPEPLKVDMENQTLSKRLRQLNGQNCRTENPTTARDVPFRPSRISCQEPVASFCLWPACDIWAFGVFWASVERLICKIRKRSVRPRAPVWYRPKALRCLSTNLVNNMDKAIA